MQLLKYCIILEQDDLRLMTKWGCDGATVPNVKQKFSEEESLNSELGVFTSSLVPLELSSSTGVVWSNEVPSSTRYCRPIRIQFRKENEQLIQEEIRRIQAESSENVIEVPVEDRVFKVKYIVFIFIFSIISVLLIDFFTIYIIECRNF